MYEQCLNFLGLREDPFHVSPDPRFYYSTPAHESALAELLFGIETRQGFMLLTGEAGTGKTCLLNQILDWLRECKHSSAFIFHTHLEPIGLLRLILRDFGLPCQTKSKSELVNTLHTWLLERHTVGDVPVLILDEAQALPLQTLDELRLLLNLETPRGKLLQIILSGQPELEAKLRLPALRQLRQRIMFHSRLRLLTEEETAAYISRRLVAAGGSDRSLFPDEVVQDIYTSSVGIPRVVNLLCEHALISAYAEQQHIVSSEMIRRIAVDFDLEVNPLAVTDLEPRSYYLRLDPFPVVEKPVPPNVVQAEIEENPVLAVPDSASLETPTTAALPAYDSILLESCTTQRSWRRHQRRSAIAVLARRFAGYARRSPGFASKFAAYARRSPRLASKFAAYARSSLGFASKLTAYVRRSTESLRRFAANAPRSIGFASRSAAPRRRSPGFSSKSAAYLRKSAEFASQTGGSLGRSWHAVTYPIFSYARSVAQSFVQDCRLFSRSLTLPTPALEHGSSAGGDHEKLPMLRDVLAPIVNWLRQPITPGPNSRHRLRPPSADRK